MSKAVYIIPGFSESATSGKYKAPYRKIALQFKKRDIEPIFVNIDWKYKTMSDYVNQFIKQHKNKDNKQVYLFGFFLVL